MDPRVVWALIAIIAVVGIAAVWWVWRRQRSAHLRRQFGPEYDRAVRESGTVSRAEASLADRARRVERLHIRPLAPEQVNRYREAWTAVQSQFVDDPKGAVTEADRLVGEVMHARGYPLGDFEQRVEDISVDHADVVINYRAAREIADRHARGQATTEDLRQAMVHYRALFRDLLDIPAGAQPKATKAVTPEPDTAKGRR
jgi:hypothetical protein